MCLLVVHHDIREQRLGKKKFRRAAQRNPDGIGFSMFINDELVTEKYLDTDEAWDAYRAAADLADGPALLHFRWATSGLEGLHNVHPFPLDAGAVMAHNGVLGDGTRTDSDTRVFCETVLADRPLDWLLAEETRERMEPHIPGNKIAILAPNGDYTIWNEKLGEWNGLLWFSNEHSCAPITGFARKGPAVCSAKYADIDEDLDDAPSRYVPAKWHSLRDDDEAFFERYGS